MKQVLSSVAMSFPLASGDLIFLDKNHNYQGFSRESEHSIDFYDRNNMPSGWRDKHTNTLFDRNNRPSFNIYDMNRK